MKESEKVKVHIEIGDARANFEGDVDQVFELAARFLTQICPGLKVLRRLIYTPDITKLAEKIGGLIEISPEGPIMLFNFDVPTRDAVCLILLGAYLGKVLGILGKDSISSRDLARMIGKARKTVSNEMPRLISEGVVERTSEGEYRLTILGIKKTEKIIERYKK